MYIYTQRLSFIIFITINRELFDVGRDLTSLTSFIFEKAAALPLLCLCYFRYIFLNNPLFITIYELYR